MANIQGANIEYGFFEGKPVETIPQAIEQGYKPLIVGELMELRIYMKKHFPSEDFTYTLCNSTLNAPNPIVRFKSGTAAFSNNPSLVTDRLGEVREDGFIHITMNDWRTHEARSAGKTLKIHSAEAYKYELGVEQVGSKYVRIEWDGDRARTDRVLRHMAEGDCTMQKKYIDLVSMNSRNGGLPIKLQKVPEQAEAVVAIAFLGKLGASTLAYDQLNEDMGRIVGRKITPLPKINKVA